MRFYLTLGMLLAVSAGCGRGGFEAQAPCSTECVVVVELSADSVELTLGGVSSGGIEGPHGCPAGSVLTGLETEYDKNDRLKGFRMRCHELVFDRPSSSLRWGAARAGGENFGNATLEYSQTLDCPEDELVVGFRAFVGALTNDVSDLRVMDRLEVSCASLQVKSDSTLEHGSISYVAQTLEGSSGLLPHNQLQDSIQCPDPGVIVQITTSGGGHTDHFDALCTTLGLRD